MHHQAKGYLLHYIARGDGPPAILIHGLAASLHDWEALLPELASSGYRAFAVDLLGHGESYKPDDPLAYSLDSLFASLEGWIEQIKESPPFFLVGHSLGGYLSLKYALRHPEKVRAMVLIAPLYRLNQVSPLLRWLNPHLAWAATAIQFVPLPVIDRVLGWDPIDADRFSPEARWQVAVDYKSASPYNLNILQTLPDLSTKLHEINIPTLVIWGEHDRTLSPRSFPPLLKGLPQVTGRPLHERGHQPHIGDPQRVNRMILDFIRQHPGQW
jgi:pimeloyl-ACP methyl ester carboxylesterase